MREQEFYREHLEEHKQKRYLLLAKKGGVAEHKVEAALEKKKAVQLFWFCVLGQVPPVEFSFVDTHPDRGMTEEMVRFPSLSCRCNRWLRCSATTTISS